MSWNNDQHGLVFKSSELKLYAPSHSYAMKISQIWRQAGVMRILTYSLPSIAYVHEQLHRRPYDIQIVCHEKFTSKAEGIKNKFPDIDIRTLNSMHSKVILIEPKTLYVGSENFGNSGWFETCIAFDPKRRTTGLSNTFLIKHGMQQQLSGSPTTTQSKSYFDRLSHTLTHTLPAQ